MIIYEAEKNAGLTDLLNDPAKSHIIFASLAEPLNKKEIDNLTVSLANLKSLSNLAKAQITDKDLYPLKTILVTTSWNKNDDVFTKEEVWAARHTPEDKPFNLGHAELDIIGHITENRCIDDKYHIIADDSSADLIPDKFHILTSAVIYRAIADEDRKELIEKIIAEIAQGKWYVSMECYFQGFDYAVRTPDGSQNKIIARSKDSAFLTQHLRAYGGNGEYDGYKVGRLMRNICFSGKGLVEKPANPESIILTDKNSRAVSFGSEIYNINQLTFSSDKGEKTMAEANANANEKLVETLEKNLETAKASIQSHEAKIAELEKANKVLASEKEDAGKKYEDVLKELNETKATIKLTERVSLLIDAGLDKTEAESKAKKFDSANDEMFSEVVALAKKATKKDNDNDEEDEDDDDEDNSKAEKLPGDEKKLKKGKKKTPYVDKTAGKSDDDDDMDADEEDKKATDKAKKSKDEASKMKKGKAANMGLKQSKEYDSGEENANDSNESDVGTTDDVSKVRKALSEADADEDEYEDSEADENDLDLNGEAELDEETSKVCAHVADYFDGMFGKKNKKDEE